MAWLPLVWPEPWPGTRLRDARRDLRQGRPAAPSPSPLPPSARPSPPGRDLTEHDNVLIAAAACELHPTR
jgi:hypothetical protein